MDTIVQILMWALPTGCVGGAIGWFTSKRIRAARESLEAHNAYKQMYDDLTSTYYEIQRDYRKLLKEHGRLYRLISSINMCVHYDECPLRDGLQRIQKDFIGDKRSSPVRQPSTSDGNTNNTASCRSEDDCNAFEDA